MVRRPAVVATAGLAHTPRRVSLKKFESLELIAKGGMAEVYRARTAGPEGFAKDVCVKKILPHLTADEQFVKMFINEAKLAATLSYANIVQVHDLCVSSDSEYFIVMEYVHGKDLSDVIRAAQLAGKEIPPALAVYVAREVAKGLYYAHTKADADGTPLGIIHRDISPQNVLCSFMGEVKLTDFGIAKASSIMNKTAVGILKGKYGYMSPEQARGEPLDARSDIFCLGIVLYEMLVGERCFAGASDYSTLNLMREAQVTPPTQINKAIPAELEGIVLRALSKDRGARWQDALELEGALAAFAQKSGGEARSAELARFVKGLFAGAEGKKPASTGVLALSSIAAPASPPAGKKPREKTQDLGALEASAGDPTPPPAPKVDRPDRPKKKKLEDAPPAVDDTAQAPAVALPKPAEPAAPAAEERPKKVARVKGDAAKPEAEGEGKDAKAAAKKAAAADKRPVARRDLKPGLSKLVPMGREGQGRVWKAAAVIVLVGGVGAGLGYRESRSVSRDSTLRVLERAGLEAGPDKVTVLIDSDPAGARVKLDGEAQATLTPLTVERPRDAVEHRLVLELDGFPTLERGFTYEAGPVTILRENMPGDEGELVVRTKPTNLEVRVDGKLLGNAPLSADVARGRHTVVISGPGVEPWEGEIEIVPRQKLTLDKTLGRPGRETRAYVSTEPPSRIVLDGKDTGQRADGSALALDPGTRHRLTLVDDARGVERDVWIELAEGEEKTFVLEL